MHLYLLPTSHLVDDKIYLELPYLDNRLICSNEGFLYFKNLDISVHKYLLRQSKDEPTYPLTCDKLVPHLFEYNKIYLNYEVQKTGIDFTSFYYFTKTSKKEILFAEIYLQEIINYCKEKLGPKQETRTLSRDELESFLYNISEDKSKYIIHPSKGLKYVHHPTETISIQEKLLDLSDDGILSLYNKRIESMRLFGQICARKNSSNFTKADSIENVPSFPVSPQGYLGIANNLFIISKHSIAVSELDIAFISKGLFKLKTSEILVTEALIRDMMVSCFSDVQKYKKPVTSKNKKQRRSLQ